MSPASLCEIRQALQQLGVSAPQTVARICRTVGPAHKVVVVEPVGRQEVGHDLYIGIVVGDCQSAVDADHRALTLAFGQLEKHLATVS